MARLMFEHSLSTVWPHKDRDTEGLVSHRKSYVQRVPVKRALKRSQWSMTNKFEAATKLAGFLQYRDQISTVRGYLNVNHFLNVISAVEKKRVCIWIMQCTKVLKLTYVWMDRHFLHGKAVVKFHNLLGKWK